MSEVSKLVALDATGMHAAPRVAMIFVSQYQYLASSRQSYTFHAIFKFRGFLPGMPPRRNVLPAPHESNPKSPLDVPGVVKKETASRASIFGRVALFSACWMIVAVSLKLFLEPSLEGKIFDIFVQVQFCTLALALFDVLLSFNSPARWFLIHAFGNFVVVWFSISDTLYTIMNPLQCIGGSFDLHSTYMVPAIHIYHMICFHCTKDDYFHHFVFAGIICPMGFYFQAGPIQNAVGFFICGLPGGLDYVMLALVKYKMMFALTEKKFNARINVWLRSPGLLFCAFSIWVAAPRPVNAGLLLGALLVALNGQYYMQMVVGNAFVKTRSDGADPYNC